MKAVFLDVKTVDRGDVDWHALRNAAEQWEFFDQTSAEQVAQRLRDVHIVVTNKVLLDEAVLCGAKSLRLVCVAATGYDNVDIGAAQRLGIPVCNVRGYATESVAQHVIACLLCLANNLMIYRRDVFAGRWRNSDMFCFLDYPIRMLSQLRLGVIGWGELGKAVARRAEMFGMEVWVAERRGREPRAGRFAFEQVLQEVDVLTLHCPLNPSTQGLITGKELAMMKPGAILINTARGGIVHEADLADALRAGHLGGAAVDVLSEEPPVSGNPLLDLDQYNVIVTPHIAWASTQARQKLVDEIAENIKAWRAGNPRHQVTA